MSSASETLRFYNDPSFINFAIKGNITDTDRAKLQRNNLPSRGISYEKFTVHRISDSVNDNLKNAIVDKFTIELCEKLQEKGVFTIGDENLKLSTVLEPAIQSEFIRGIIRYVAAPTNSEKLMGMYVHLGDWFLDWLGSRLMEYAGEVAIYGDFATAPEVSINLTTTSSGHYRFFNSFTIGDLIREQLSTGKQGFSVDLHEAKLYACAQAHQYAFNRTAFYGKQASTASNTDFDVYGLFNHPRLEGFQTENKKITAMDFDEITGFFNKYMDRICNNTMGYFNVNSKVKVGLTISDYNKIYTVKNQFGSTAFEKLKVVYPNMELVPCIEMQAATSDNKDVAVFIGESEEINPMFPTCCLGYSRKMHISNIVQSYNGYSGQVSSGCFGLVAFKPSLITRCKFT